MDSAYDSRSSTCGHDSQQASSQWRFPACAVIAVLATACLASLATSAASSEEPIVWQIGRPDGSAIEMAPGSRKELTFQVGRSVPSRDFAGHHIGSVGFDPSTTGEKPYAIDFQLGDPPAGAYALTLDLIFRAGAPQQLQVTVNEKRGIFPLEPAPKKDIDVSEANSILLARQQLVVPIDASWLKQGANRILLAPLGLGALDYDALTLARLSPPPGDAAASGAPPALEPRFEPTVFFQQQGERLLEICRLLVPFRQRFREGTFTVRLGDETIERSLPTCDYDFGVLDEQVHIASRDQAVKVLIEVALDGKSVRVEQPFQPSKHWQVFICPKVHNDVGYTDLQPHVNELDTRNTDTVLSILAKYPFYKFNFETAWLVDNFLDCRPRASHDEFFHRAGEGRAVINAFYLNLMTGICTGEELYRAMYFTHRLHRERGSNFDFACLTDAPAHSWFLPTLLSDVGIQAFSNGSNQTRAPILHFSDLNEDSPFHWEGINGERILMWYARSYTQWKRLTGPDFVAQVASYEYLKSSVPQFLNRYLRPDYAPDAVMIYGAYVDNAEVPETGEAELIEKWNQEFVYPKLVVASDAEYFNYVRERFSDRLPVYRGDAGAFWEDGVASSAEATTWNRRTQQTLPLAETASSFATLFQPLYRYPAEDFRAAWKNVLFYDEHTWGAHNSVTQPDRSFVTRQWEIKENYARQANLDARNLLARSFNRLCQQIAVTGNTVFAFNWQPMTRSEPLEAEIDDNAQLVDLETNQAVPLDVLLRKDGYKKVRFLAKDVPPMGYRGYGVRALGQDAATPEAAAAHAPAGTIESEHYRLVIDEKTGGLRSLFDKAESRELVDPRAEYALNQFLYVSGGQNTRILDLTYGTPPAELTLHRPKAARIVESVTTPLGPRITVETQGKNAPRIRTEYRLYDQIKRLDIINTVSKVATREKEAVYFAFPFAADQPAFECQIQNGWLRPNEDQLPGACREWFTPQNLVHLRDGDFSVAWSTPDAPLVNLVDINRGKWLTELPVTNGHVFSYVMHNYWFTNYRASQEGTPTFRYSITSGRSMDRSRLARFDVDTRSPVTAYPFLSTFSARIDQQDRPLSPGSGSLLSLDADNLTMVVVKAAEDGEGYIVRFCEVAGRDGEAVLRSPVLKIAGAHLCNGVEDNLRELAFTAESVKLPYQANRYGTLRLQLVTVHRPEGRDAAIWRVSPSPAPPHNVADLHGPVTAKSFAATLWGGGHLNQCGTP